MNETTSLMDSLPMTTLRSSSDLDTDFVPSEAILSSKARRISEICLDLTFNFIIALGGTILNVLIIIVFSKQGFKESVNISMTAIAIWDFIKCLAGASQRMAGVISLWSEADALSWSNICTAIFSYLICFSSYVTSVLASYVAIERCLCVSMPFKVKTLITPRVTFWCCILISFVVFGWFFVLFFIYDILWVYSPKYNTSIAIYQYNDFYNANKGPLFEYYNLSGIIWPLASFVVIVVATVIIVYKLKESSKFRASQGDAKTDSPQQLSSRDRQVVKMLLVIVVVYVICLSPRITLYLAKYIIYDFYFLRKYHNFFLLISYILWIFDLGNGAINFFIFYSMSSSFKRTFLKLFITPKHKTKP